MNLCGESLSKVSSPSSLALNTDLMTCDDVRGFLSMEHFVFIGNAGGSHSDKQGGGSDYICLPADPIFEDVSHSHSSDKTRVYGTKYRYNPRMDGVVPCAVCQSRGKNVMMIPARNACYPGFSVEYTGYLATSYVSAQYRSTHVCVDGQPELGEGAQSGAVGGAYLYRAEIFCGAVPCSTYHDGGDLLCVVCSR